MRNPKTVANWIINFVVPATHKAHREMNDPIVSSDDLGTLIDLIETKLISHGIAKDVFTIMIETGQTPLEVLADHRDLLQASDTKTIDTIIGQVLSENSEKVTSYKSGDTKLLRFFIGQVMKVAGKVDARYVSEQLTNRLNE